MKNRFMFKNNVSANEMHWTGSLIACISIYFIQHYENQGITKINLDQMSIIDTYFRKEELSIINPFVSQRMEKGIWPVATLYILIQKRDKVMWIYTTLKTKILIRLKFNKSHTLHKLKILGRGISDPLKNYHFVTRPTIWWLQISPPRSSFLAKILLYTLIRLRLSCQDSFFFSWCIGHCQKWTHRIHQC